MSNTKVAQDRAGAGGRVYKFRAARKRTQSKAEDWQPAPMYRVIDAVLVKDLDLPSWVRLVAIAIARRFDNDGFAFMSMRDIGARTKLSRACVWRAVQILKDRTPAMFEIQRRPNTARTRRGVYEFRLVLNCERATEARDHSHPARFTPDHLRQLWNRLAPLHGLQPCNDMKGIRRREAEAAIAEYPLLNYWQELIVRCTESPFVCGLESYDRDAEPTPKGIDFLIRHHVQISEGKYE